MLKYFNVFLEFDHKQFHSKVVDAIASKDKGYVCVVDANVLTIAQKDEEYREILNTSLVNTCDGSSIALLAGWIYKKKFLALNGPEIFNTYIERPYKQILLGSTELIMNKIKQRLVSKEIGAEHLYYLPLPFNTVNDFDYYNIANEINILEPEIIWVSLGAPKQEQFMIRLLPHIKCGVMFGIGAAFNFYIGELHIPKFKIGRLRFIWLNRFFKEPIKLSKRLINYGIAMPKLYFEEWRRNKDIRK